jgi:porin
MRALALAACLALLPILARAQEEAVSDDFGLTGDWGGLRSTLKDDGFLFRITDTTEAGWNPAGGDRHTAAAAGQVTLGASADLGKLIGDKGGSVYLVTTKRYGSGLSSRAGLDALMEVQDIHGRGDMWRLTQFYLQQDIGKSLDVKLGRMSPGQDFDAFSCDFQNLTFCAAQAGNLVGDYWYNWPVSQWGVRARFKFADHGYVEAGAFDVNPDNLDQGFNLDTAGGKGTLIPFEAAYTPTIGGLPGSYALGGWYSTQSAPDVILDRQGELQALTGAPPLQHSGRYGWYLDVKQQVSGQKDKRGLSLFLRFVQADRRTSMLDRQFAVGATYKAPFPSRPDDQVGLGFGATHVNNRIATGQKAADAVGLPFVPVQHTEYAAEINYDWQLTDGLSLMPNLQYVRNPGGVTTRKDALVLGVRFKAKL